MLAEITIATPIVWLGAFISVIVAVGSAVAVLLSTGTRTNLQLLREENIDLARNYEREKQENVDLTERFEQHKSESQKKISTLEGKVETLQSVISGAEAVKELGNLLVTMYSTGQTELLGAINATRSELASGQQALLAIFGEGRRAGDDERHRTTKRSVSSLGDAPGSTDR